MSKRVQDIYGVNYKTNRIPRSIYQCLADLNRCQIDNTKYYLQLPGDYIKKRHENLTLI